MNDVAKFLTLIPDQNLPLSENNDKLVHKYHKLLFQLAWQNWEMPFKNLR